MPALYTSAVWAITPHMHGDQNQSQDVISNLIVRAVHHRRQNAFHDDEVMYDPETNLFDEEQSGN